MRFFLFLPVLLSAKLAFAAPLPAFEGTVTQTQNGASVRAKIAWLPPDSLQIEVARDDATSTPAQIITASGDQTLLFDAASKRTRRYPFNIAKSWWRSSGLSSGGPANFLFAGTPFPTDAAQGRFLRRDDILFGGSGADAYYAAVKTSSRRFAATIVTETGAGATPASASRTEKNEAGTPILSAKIGLDAGLPTTVEAIVAGAKISYKYDLKAVAAPAAFAEIAGTVVEETQLDAPSSYTGESASSLFNRGAALAQNEDFPAAFAAFEAAAQTAPTASAPVIAQFELALAVRDDARAAAALTKIEALGLDPLETLPRRARLSLLRRDYAGAKAAYDSTATTAPNFFALALLRGDLAASTGQIEAARDLWRGILAAPTAPRASQALAAQNLALYATPSEFAAILASIPNQNEAQKLGRALIQLRAAPTDLPELPQLGAAAAPPAAAETTQWDSDDFEAAYALGLEGAARDDAARGAWETLARRGDDATKNRARAHLMTLAARRGDVAASLGFWHDLNTSLEASGAASTARDAARLQFLDAWQKAFRSEPLRAALANRVAATNSTEADLRLFLNFQEQNGSAEDVQNAIETGLLRFPRGAFWLGRRAENLVVQANSQPGTPGGTARRAQLFKEAFARLDDAAAAAPGEPFYRFQKALTAAQRAAKQGGVIDPGAAAQDTAYSKRETDKLLADFPGDPDVLVSAALQSLTLDGETPARRALQLAQQALDSAPGDGDRHALIWAARQAMASALRRLGEREAAGVQWESLLLGARSSGEQLTLAIGYFGLIEGPQNAPAPPADAGRADTQPRLPGAPLPPPLPPVVNTSGAGAAADLLTQMASEAWNYSASRTLLDNICARVAASPVAPAISAALLASDRDAAALAGASLAGQRILRSQSVLQNEAAPPAASAELDRAGRDLSLFLAKLQGVAAGENRVLSARAAAFLSENAALDGEVRLQLLRRALEIEPRDAALRFALIGALSSVPGTPAVPGGDAAKSEREIASRVLDFEPEVRRQLANAARRAGDLLGAAQIAGEIFNITARAPEVGTNDFQRIAFSYAKSAYSAGQTARGVEVYEGLSLPQWNAIDRAAALLAELRSANAAGKPDDAAPISAQVTALGLSQSQIEAAIAFADEVEN